MVKGKCRHGYYFGPLGKCQDCGVLCDTPAQYPASCKLYCPDYKPKERTTTTALPPIPATKSGSINTSLTIIGGFSSLALLIVIVFIFCWLWKKVFRKQFSRLAERRRMRKLSFAVPVQSDQNEEPENIPLNNNDDTDLESARSVDGDFRNDALNPETNDYRGLARPERSDSTQSVITIEDDISSYTTGDFDFGQTFPFHSLSTLESVLEHSSGQTRRKTRAGSEFYV